jgi:two-component sensor histidine kinase
LQGNNLTDVAAKQALRSSQNRVRAVAALHNHLYQLALEQPVGLQEFAEELMTRIRDCHGVAADQVTVDIQLHGHRPREEWIMPIALVLNEALSNCFKHAYADGRQGHVEVRFTTDGELAHLTVQDDGPGLPEDFEPNACLGLGLKVAGVFADQMKGKIHLKNIIPHGLLFDLQFTIRCVDN